MTTLQFPDLDTQSIAKTRDPIHSYARVLGSWLTSCRPRRKHWWHASLRPSLKGLTTGVIHADIDFELELNLIDCLLQGQTATGEELTEPLHGQPPAEIAQKVSDFLLRNGIDKRYIPEEARHSTKGFDEYAAEHVRNLARALNSVSATMELFRSGIREETSPIQLWPHHFDLAMLWLPGEKVIGQDPENEEYADKQMNFGFTFGDKGIPEPYFYVTAYPLPDAFPNLQLPAGTVWHTEGFSGAVLLYRSLIESANPHNYLINQWNGLLAAGRDHMTVE